MSVLNLRAYALATAAVIAGLFFVPFDSWTQVLWQVAAGWIAAGCTCYAVYRQRPRARIAWLCFAAGVFLNATGVGVYYVMLKAFGMDPATYPTWADPFWLALFPALVAGMAFVIRRRSPARDWSLAVDTAIVTVGLGLVAWVFVIQPQWAAATSWKAKAVLGAYPVGDLVVLAMVVRVLLGGGAFKPALRLVTAALAMFLAADIGWTVVWKLALTPSHATQNALHALSLAGFALVGAAALHSSMTEVDLQGPRRDPRLSPLLLGLLSVSSLLAPGVLEYQSLTHTPLSVTAVVVSCTILVLLAVVRMALLFGKVQAQSQQLRDLSLVDELTGLPNRRAWSAELPTALERARRDGAPLAVAMVDLDHFKRYNDTYGHQAGDRMLKEAAAAWGGVVRAVDQLARYGGEEFIVLLPKAGEAEAVQVLERLRPCTPDGQTFSAGVATWNGTETSDELIARADKALYQAKQGGRACTAIAADGTPAPSASTVSA